jgi:6-phosphofructokinase 1
VQPVGSLALGTVADPRDPLPTGGPAVADPSARPSSIAVLTSGGDASGMNAAVRAVVRTCIHESIDVYAVYEGYLGLVEGGDNIRLVDSSTVGGVMQLGGTVIGSARSEAFRTREGRRTAAANLVARSIDALVVIGGDGSLTGANIFRQEWPELLAELVEAGEIEPSTADAHPALRLVGLVGSIDNDMFGTDMTIGADTALHRITEAMDALHSTAASHQRSFVVEVMGRRCGYLALMGGLAAGANWVLIPEQPADAATWEREMCDALRAGRAQGRRQNMVVVAEGAQDTDGNPITADRVKEVLESELNEDTRVTILGHVQRGGAPSAFDRWLSTLLGYRAVKELIDAPPDAEPALIGIRENRVISSPLMANVEQTHAVATAIDAGEYDRAMQMRGGSFTDSWETFHTLVQSTPSAPAPGTRQLRLAILHGGGPAPGMNTAVRAAVRLAIDKGHTVLGVQNGFRGLADGDIRELDWMNVTGWTGLGGAELGTSRSVPGTHELAAIAARIEEHGIDGLLMIGGWSGYEAAYAAHYSRREHHAFDLPIVCLPASINNDLPGSEISVGADTALNSIVVDVDKIKQSAVASRRVFVVEVMGRDCGYLALMSGISSGAERVYLPEEGVTLDELAEDVDGLRRGFEAGKRLGLVIRGEGTDPVYTTGFVHALFAKESRGLFDVRQSILGHVQQGGVPSPFDRIQATRLAARCVEYLVEHASEGAPGSAMIGLKGGKVGYTELAYFPDLIETGVQRPKQQSWLDIREVARVMARPDVVRISAANGGAPRGDA